MPLPGSRSPASRPASIWQAGPTVTLYAAYKEGFKSGGVDNSALPTGTLDPAANPDSPDFLIYGSEHADGFEAGVTTAFANGAWQLNAEPFPYVYDDLQVQLFNSKTIQIETFNASELTAEGQEFDLRWVTPVAGLSPRSALAFTDTRYTDDFVNAAGQNLRGWAASQSADAAALVGSATNGPCPAAGGRACRAMLVTAAATHCPRRWIR